jgi:maltose alpha-D-glucosyltransferase / alpha-amylase
MARDLAERDVRDPRRRLTLNGRRERKSPTAEVAAIALDDRDGLAGIVRAELDLDHDRSTGAEQRGRPGLTPGRRVKLNEDRVVECDPLDVRGQTRGEEKYRQHHRPLYPLRAAFPAGFLRQPSKSTFNPARLGYSLVATMPEMPTLAPWYQDAVIYQLHVKAFADGNGDGIGDFAGLIDKLPYVRDLGATAVWLLPFYPSPLRDDGYDIADYRSVHPAYGTLRDARAFVKEAHRLGLRVITELVVNHTSDQHPWFQRARRAPRGSSASDFYVWSDSAERYTGTRIIFTDTETSNWSWDPLAGQYYWHRFFSHQPDLNFEHPAVFAGIANAMRRWFAIGVDGMRLDAVPYLCEREGTSNENLPETHAVVKRLRKIVDDEFPDHLLIAEANQWPEDASAYFGDGDECHMAFHFPLMPRMFMSIASEDRYPLYDIMRQTPAIPSTCQWAIFLRNHDELTLEMVSDRERAFMYNFYASDVRARVNVGIRRRLAPLMENDRRKIELMTSLLLSLPGTPVIYYGDEIGMGDNIYLGDRDGVRTPMQWSADRNGGFSRADAQRLYLPAIMDPIYGFPAVNVEAQERSPSSLLHWVRRLIGVRRAHGVFGRGNITLLHPDNRHVAAYMRELDGETVLCVANLARNPQAVSLDLSRFGGRTPVEMTGWSAFPRIVDDRYVLTLPGYGFFWFSLAASADAPVSPSSTDDATRVLPEFVTVVLPRSRSSLLDDPAHTTLERDVLPALLTANRLIPRAQAGQRIALRDVIWLDSTDESPALAIVTSDREGAFVVPSELTYAPESECSPPTLRAAFARARYGRHEGLLFDAGIDDKLWSGLFAALRNGGIPPAKHGALTCETTWSLPALPVENPYNVRRPQSGDRRLSAVIDETVFLTLFRRTVQGIHPAIELARYLHDAHFTHGAPLLGSFTYRSSDGIDVGVGLARRFILAQGNAWNVLQALLHRSLERRTTDEREPIDRIVAAAGTRLAEMHDLLARPTDDPAFAPTTYTEAAAATAQAELHELAEIAFTAAARDGSAEARAALALRPQIERIIESAPLRGELAIRVHGDFHLARLLVTDADVLIIDPGVGEAVRPAPQRRRKVSPFLDVATLIRSLDEVTAAAGFDLGTDPTEDPATFRPLLRETVRLAATAFGRSYLDRARELGLIDLERDRVRGLVDVFLAQATLEAIAYEAHERPERMRALYAELTRIFERSAETS